MGLYIFMCVCVSERMYVMVAVHFASPVAGCPPDRSRPIIKSMLVAGGNGNANGNDMQ